MSKVNVVKSSVKNNKDIETVLLDDEENGPVPHDDPDIDPELVTLPVEHSSHISDKDPQIKASLLKGIYLVHIELVKQFTHYSSIVCLIRYIEWR